MWLELGLLRYREQKLAKTRSGLGFEDFVAYFSGEDIPLYKLREVYNYFQNWQYVKNFPVLPNDDLYKVYGIVDEDVDDAVIELAERWRVKLPATFDGLEPVRTVGDIVHLLNRLPQEMSPLSPATKELTLVQLCLTSETMCSGLVAARSLTPKFSPSSL